MLVLGTVILIITLLLLVLNWANSINKHWERKGIKFFKPVPFFGNNLPAILNKKTIPNIIEDLYYTFPNELVVGYYEFITPKLIVRDHELVQKILIKDFSHFVDHVSDVYEQKNPWSAQLFMLTGNKWRAFRLQLATIFTSGKLKTMFQTMSNVGNNLLQYIDKSEGRDMDFHEAMVLFSLNIIGSNFLGIDPDLLVNPDSDFRKILNGLYDISFLNMVRLWIYMELPKIGKKTGVPHNFMIVKDYLYSIIRKVIDYRKANAIKRNDLIQMMINLKEKGKIDIKYWESNVDSSQNESNVNQSEIFDVTDDILMAQAHAFLVGGFDSVAKLLTYAMVELCINSSLQDAARKEVLLQAKLHGGLTYDAIKNMKFIEQIIKETHRLHPVVPFLLRMCTKDYTLPNGYVIQKGDPLYISISAINKDPNIYPEPDSFKPERFEEAPQPGTFLVFGEGPRICLAMKYVMFTIKYSIALLLMNYNVRISPKTKLPLRFIVKGWVNVPAEKLLLNFEKLTEMN